MSQLPLTRLKLSLQCIKDGYVSGIGGAEVHGLLFAMLEDIDPNYAAAVHQTPIKPFSIGQLRGQGEVAKGMFYLQRDQAYTFHLNGLNEQCSAAFSCLMEHIRPQHQFRLGTASCRWLKWEVVDEKAYQDLLATPVASRPRIRFISPTCFRSQGKSILFPEPNQLFGSLASRWNKFSPVPVKLEDFADHIMVSRYNLRTVYVLFNRYNQVGFTGQLGFSWQGRVSHEIKQLMSALMAFAGFSGIGYKTAMGMGEVTI